MAWPRMSLDGNSLAIGDLAESPGATLAAIIFMKECIQSFLASDESPSELSGDWVLPEDSPVALGAVLPMEQRIPRYLASD